MNKKAEQGASLDQSVDPKALQAVVRIGMLALITFICVQIFKPFAPLMMWALVLAVTLYPVALKMTPRLGSLRRASVALVILGLLILGLPTIFLGVSFSEHVNDLYNGFKAGTLNVQPPKASVKEWPFIGERVFLVWQEASDNLPAAVKHYADTVRSVLRGFLGMAGSTLATAGLFMAAMIIAGIMIAYGPSADQAMRRIARAFAGADRGDHLHELSVATIRSVALGVVGVAFIQSLLLGVGFLIAGMPAAGLLALLVLIMGILQLPALLLTIPAIAWMWGAGDGGTVFNAVLSIYIIVAGLSDQVLKPILLGRGVDVPMPVVLIGALGGMVSLGLLGLFVGAVILSVGYRVFMAWVDSENSEPSPVNAEPSPANAEVVSPDMPASSD